MNQTKEMNQVFLLQNQHKQLLTKQGEWDDGRDVGCLYRSAHKDEALNQMVEANARDYTLRITTLVCDINDKRVPQILDEDLPPLGLTTVKPKVKIEKAVEVKDASATKNALAGDMSETTLVDE